MCRCPRCQGEPPADWEADELDEPEPTGLTCDEVLADAARRGVPNRLLAVGILAACESRIGDALVADAVQVCRAFADGRASQADVERAERRMNIAFDALRFWGQRFPSIDSIGIVESATQIAQDWPPTIEQRADWVATACTENLTRAERVAAVAAVRAALSEEECHHVRAA